MHRRTVLKSAGAASAALIAGCSGDSGSTTDDQETDTPTDTSTVGTTETNSAVSGESLNVLTVYYPGPSFGGLVVGDRAGYFEDLGFEDVNIEYSLQLNPMQVITDDEYDLVVAGQASGLIGAAQDVPVQGFLTPHGNAPHSLAIKADSGIETVEDFPGNTLGWQNDPTTLAYVREVLRQELSESQRDEVETATVGYDVRTLLGGDVDIYHTWPTDAPNISMELAGEADLDYINTMDFIDAPGDSVFATESFIEDNPELITEFTRGYTRGLQDVMDPDMVADVAEMCLKSLNEAGVEGIFLEGVEPIEVVQTAVERFQDIRHIDAWDTNGRGYCPIENVESNQQLLVDTGAIEEPSEAESVYTNEFTDAVHDDSGNLIWEV